MQTHIASHAAPPRLPRDHFDQRKEKAILESSLNAHCKTKKLSPHRQPNQAKMCMVRRHPPPSSMDLALWVAMPTKVAHEVGHQKGLQTKQTLS